MITRLLFMLPMVFLLMWMPACSQQHTWLVDDEAAYQRLDSPARNQPLQGFERILPEPLGAEIDPETAARKIAERRVESDEFTGVHLQDVLFAYDSAMLDEQAMSWLEADADWLLRHRNTTVRIEGHCDERGSAAYNLVLGEKRAKAVQQYLIELGIPTQRLTAVSYGKEHPVCLGHSEACHQENRRGHLAVTR